jgi:hypothetical protein
MNGATITVDDLRNRLVRAGHRVPEEEGTPRGTDVCPGPETYVTVGMNLDPTLKPAYRQRYFACYLLSEDDPVPVLRDEPAFALPELLREAAAGSPADDRFLGGPVRWLLRRLVRFDSVLLWPACRWPSPGGAFARAGLLEEVPLLRERLPADSPSLADVGAVVLDLGREPDWRVLWEAANEVSQSIYDFFVGDLGCREVYRMHHHGKVEVAIPDGPARQEMLDELAGWSDLIEDCSGYDSGWDDEDDDQG